MKKTIIILVLIFIIILIISGIYIFQQRSIKKKADEQIQTIKQQLKDEYKYDFSIVYKKRSRRYCTVSLFNSCETLPSGHYDWEYDLCSKRGKMCTQLQYLDEDGKTVYDSYDLRDLIRLDLFIDYLDKYNIESKADEDTRSIIVKKSNDEGLINAIKEYYKNRKDNTSVNTTICILNPNEYQKAVDTNTYCQSGLENDRINGVELIASLESKKINNYIDDSLFEFDLDKYNYSTYGYELDFTYDSIRLLSLRS